MNKLITYIKDSFVEVVENVTWPTIAELSSSTSLVIVASIIFASVVFVMDFGFKTIIDLFY